MYDIRGLPGPDGGDSLAFGLSSAGHAAGVSFTPQGISGLVWTAGISIFQ